MPCPFPGMDPYLESSASWRNVHAGLIAEMLRYLAPRLRPKYRVAIDERVYLEPLDDLDSRPARLIGLPDLTVTRTPVSGGGVAVLEEVEVAAPVDAELGEAHAVEIREGYLRIHSVESGAVVTAIELLSPTNKVSRRDDYLIKRHEILASFTHLVEIDLLRAGAPMPLKYGSQPAGDYRIIVSRSAVRPRVDLFPFSVRERIPTIPVPLLPGDKEVALPLNKLFHELYEVAGYDLGVDYRKPCDPPLNADDAEWAAKQTGADKAGSPA